MSLAYSDALKWLYGCQLFGVKLGLDTTRNLLDLLEVDTSRLPVFHVAGTNGKGSTCAFLEAICRQRGLRTGLFTSPHLVHFAERIRVNGRNLDEAVLAAELNRLRDLVSGWEPHPTFFELTTVLGLRCFLAAEVEVIILETGLGGRLDATNAIESSVAVITSIGLDHQHILGETLAEIAGEKAGILKPGRPVVTGRQAPEALAVIRQRAKELECRLHEVTEPLPSSAKLGLQGPHQHWNAALAIKALEVSPLQIAPGFVAQGLAATTFPGRFEEVDTEQGPVIVDCAHNCAAVAVLVATWRARFGTQKAAVVFGAVRNKDLHGMARTLEPITERLFAAPIDTQRGYSSAELLHQLGQPDSESFASVGDAIHAAQRTGLPVLITGSIFLVGAALEALGWADAPWESSAQ